METTIIHATQKRKLHDVSMTSDTSPKQARTETSPEGQVVNQSNLLDQSNLSRTRKVDVASLFRGTHNQSILEKTSLNSLDLIGADQTHSEAHDSAHELSIKLKQERSANEKYEEYLQSLISEGDSDSFMWQIAEGYSPIMAEGHSPILPDISGAERLRLDMSTPLEGASVSGLTARRSSYSQTPRSSLFHSRSSLGIPSSQREAGGIPRFENEAGGNPRSQNEAVFGTTLSDSLDALHESLRDSRQADKLYEMKLKSLLVDSP